MITVYTQKTLVDLFRQASEDHVSVNYFNAGNLEKIFAENHDLIFPAIYVQTLGGSYQDAQQSYQFRLYGFDKPVVETQQDHQAFEYDAAIIESKDTVNQILKDIIGTVKFANQQNFILAFDSPLAPSDREQEGEVGFAVTLTITQDCPLTLT